MYTYIYIYREREIERERDRYGSRACEKRVGERRQYSCACVRVCGMT